MWCRTISPTSSTERLPLTGRRDQGPEAGKAVRRDQAQSGQLSQSLLHLGGQQTGERHQLVEERGAALLEDIFQDRRIAGELIFSVLPPIQPLIGVLPQEQRNRGRANRTSRPPVRLPARLPPRDSSHHAERVQQGRV